MGEFQSKTFTPVEIRSRITPRAEKIGVTVAAGLTLPIGTILGEQTVGGLYAAYDNTLHDGTEVARGILAYSVNTGATIDARGLVGQNCDVAVPMYIHGDFVKSLVLGLDAAAIADLQMRDLGSRDEVTF